MVSHLHRCQLLEQTVASVAVVLVMVSVKLVVADYSHSAVVADHSYSAVVVVDSSVVVEVYYIHSHHKGFDLVAVHHNYFEPVARYIHYSFDPEQELGYLLLYLA
jgi:predicted tellurium resistance membrane protein TerC